MAVAAQARYGSGAMKAAPAIPAKRRMFRRETPKSGRPDGLIFIWSSPVSDLNAPPAGRNGARLSSLAQPLRRVNDLFGAISGLFSGREAGLKPMAFHHM